MRQSSTTEKEAEREMAIYRTIPDSGDVYKSIMTSRSKKTQRVIMVVDNDQNGTMATSPNEDPAHELTHES